MREIRTSGSEGRAVQLNAPPLPLSGGAATWAGGRWVVVKALRMSRARGGRGGTGQGTRSSASVRAPERVPMQSGESPLSLGLRNGARDRNLNCVVATRRGEQRGRNCQSVTKATLSGVK